MLGSVVHIHHFKKSDDYLNKMMTCNIVFFFKHRQQI